MSDVADTLEDIVLDYDLDEAPEKVWRALTRPELVAAWLGPNDMARDVGAPEIGRQFALEPTPDKPVECEILEADQERRLSWRWREADGQGGMVESTVTFEVTPTPPGGSHLRLVHSGFRAAGTGSMTGAANDNEISGYSRLLARASSPVDRLRVRTTLTTVEILMPSLSKHKDFGPSMSQQPVQWSLKWAA
jgi:uncharacterized protein YndB with AHSA1/START domain